jgi:nucleolar GTP-binding protein
MLTDLHPYEAAVADLTIIARVKTGNPSLKDTLERLKQLRALTSKTAKEYAALASICVSAIEAKELLATGMAELERIYKEAEEATALDDLIAIQKDLRRIPVIDLDLPTVVLVGAPNVGKSSIVRAVSTGTPEVNDYPFTTRGVTIGHILGIADDFTESKEIRFQVMDTPGLLDRPEEERNEMERLTFASLAHLPTAVMFVIDPTGLSGEKSTFQAQLNVRNYLKSRFPKRPWLDVVSKGDIPIPPEVEAMLPPGHLSVSVMSGKNIDVLKAKVEDTLYNLRAILIARKRAEEEEHRRAATLSPSPEEGQQQK